MIRMSRRTGRVEGGSGYAYIDGVYIYMGNDNYLIDTDRTLENEDTFYGAQYYYGPLIEMVD